MQFTLRTILAAPVLSLAACGFWLFLDKTGDWLFWNLIEGSWMSRACIAASEAGLPNGFVDEYLIYSLPDLPGMILALLIGVPFTVARIPCSLLFAILVPTSRVFCCATQNWHYFVDHQLLTAAYAIVIVLAYCVVFVIPRRPDRVRSTVTVSSFWLLIAITAACGYGYN